MADIRLTLWQNAMIVAAMDASSIIAACGGTSAVAKALGAKTNTVLYWRRRGSIPARHWVQLVALAESKGASSVTFAALAETRAALSVAA